MAYELSWYAPHVALYLRIEGNYSLQEAQEVNSLLLPELDHSPDNLVLVLDATNWQHPINLDQIRNSQTYKDHPKLKHIYVVAKDDSAALATQIIFNISRACLHVFDDVDTVETVLNR